MKTIRIGSGAGYGGDRLEPALTLMEAANLDYIGFECLAERTIALAQKQKRKDPSKGYNELLEHRMGRVLPLAYEKGVKVITNMGAANPRAALDVVAGIAASQGLRGLRIAAVLGDDIYDRIGQYSDLPTVEMGMPLKAVSKQILSANAYLGFGPIVEALEAGADIVITGRVADPALFLAPLVYEFGWAADDFDKMGKGTLVGHLLECAGQITGGYYADPGKKDVPDLWNLGFPYAEVHESGDGVVSKVPGTGGTVNRATCTEQMLYEIHDPSHYVTPDCIADFSNVTFRSVGKDRVSFQGASGASATGTFKASVGYENGFFGEGEISYGGSNCVQRGRLAADIVKKRLEVQNLELDEIRYDLIGMNSISPASVGQADSPNEVRLRVSGRTESRLAAEVIANEVQALYTNGPAGGGGATKRVNEVLSVVSILVPKSDIQTSIVIKAID